MAGETGASSAAGPGFRVDSIGLLYNETLTMSAMEIVLC